MMQPIIILGMHRSGTSLISRFVEAAGIFMGEKKDHNNESLFFLEINEHLLRCGGASWDNPLPFNYLLQDDELLSKAIDYVMSLFQSHHMASYLGVKKYLKYRSLASFDKAWGWKDPRTIFTFPIWEKVVPRVPKIVVVHRHGIDVAKSLVRRQAETRRKIAVSSAVMKRLKSREKITFTDSARCSLLKNAFQLWIEYELQLKSLMNTVNGEVIELRYEDVLYNPEHYLYKIHQFVNPKIDSKLIQKFTHELNIEKAFGFRNDNSMLDFETENAEILKKIGY